uniref:NADH-ubiquinone oxidoreductase chain 6 n=1 Tax=Ctenochauliodes nigrovenosus TaxID=1641417 RepID=A0A8K1T8F3_9NEOP|nr:NADH dehydrogenase subunit 6 [Ctenochauliodes nigrovenosus]
MMEMIIISSLLMSMNFILTNHPLSMGLILLIQTILISMITGMLMQSFWFSYILFLIMLGGMLVLFIYMTSLASNELFSLSTKMIIINLMMIMSFMIILYIYYYPHINNMNLDTSMIYQILNQENSIELNKLYNFPTMNLTLILINYLFLTLIIVVNITNINYGPLRKMN